MGDGVTKKKLPFKPTALRKAAAPAKPAVSAKDGKRKDDGGDDDDGEDDGLDLFRQAREMAPIMAADRERRLNKRKQKQVEEERRHSDMAEKQLLDSEEEGAASFPVAAEAEEARHPEADEVVQATPADDAPVSAVEDGFKYALFFSQTTHSVC